MSANNYQTYFGQNTLHFFSILFIKHAVFSYLHGDDIRFSVKQSHSTAKASKNY